MKLTLLTIGVALVGVPSASASSKLAQRAGTAATRSGFSGGTRTGGTIWHNGGAPGAAGELDIDPKLGIVAVILGNVSPPHVFPVVDATLNALRVP